MVGVDYSSKSVELASQIKTTKGEGYSDVKFEEWDLLTQSPGSWLKDGFDVVLLLECLNAGGMFVGPRTIDSHHNELCKFAFWELLK